MTYLKFSQAYRKCVQGHVDFVDEITAVLQLYNIAVIILDAIKG
ncbi:18246_t:CDS:2, partial [Gigaspora margarita]